MKSSTKILSILAASSLAASIPVVLAQGTPPPPPPPPPAAPAMPANGSGSASGRRGGRGGTGGFGTGFGAPVDQPTTEEFATLNKALKDLLSKDPDAAKVLAAHPTWNPLAPAFGGANRGGRNGRGGTGGGGGFGAGGGGGAGG